MMNKTAGELGMSNSHFMNPTGLPNPDHYSSAHDMSLLARAIIHEDPTHYAIYSQKEFFWNGIKQPNRNLLLWRDKTVDGLKTGYFQLAGFSIATTAPKGSQRVITLVMGSSNRKERDTKAMEIMNKALAELPAEAATVQAPPPAPTDPGQVSAPPAGTDTAAGEPQNTAATAPGSQPKGASSGWGKFFLGLGAGIFVFLAIVLIAGRILQQRRDGNRYIHRR